MKILSRLFYELAYILLIVGIVALVWALVGIKLTPSLLAGALTGSVLAALISWWKKRNNP